MYNFYCIFFFFKSANVVLMWKKIMNGALSVSATNQLNNMVDDDNDNINRKKF